MDSCVSGSQSEWFLNRSHECDDSGLGMPPHMDAPSSYGAICNDNV